MNYGAAVSDFFKTPKWGVSLLLGAVASLIPIAGYMLLMGWLISGFWARRDERIETFPPFDFSHFEKYLTRGVWPVVLWFLPLAVLLPICFVFIFGIVVFERVMGEAEGGGALPLVHGCGTFLFIATFVVAILTWAVLLVPLTIRAALGQAFTTTFDWPFVKRFLALMWKEMLLTFLFLWVVTVALMFVGMLFFCVGVYLLPAIQMFVTVHLYKQLYDLYLARGGEPVPISPKLNDDPPQLPVAA
jgi:hypothetical protein